jgi:outer membrane protein
MLGETKRRQPALWAIAGVAVIVWTPPAFSDTLEGSLVLAYQNNPTLNAQRASVRATDEGVPQALAGYRPRVTVNGSVGSQYTVH